MCHIANLRLDSLPKTSHSNCHLQPLDAGRMAVDGHDGARRQHITALAGLRCIDYTQKIGSGRRVFEK